MADTNPNLDPLQLPLSGSQLIEASAGTGKTFTIAILYVRLVLAHGLPKEGPLSRGLLPPDLLVVTFTEAATEELRDRIRSRLTQAAAVFGETAQEGEAPPAEQALLYQLRGDYAPAQWPECRRKLLLAAEWMDEAAISTIHAWCHRMLSEHAFDSGSLFRLSLQSDESQLLDEVARDYWRTFVYPLEAEAAAELLACWSHPGALRAAVRNLLPLREALDRPGDEPGALIAHARRERENRARELKARPWEQWREEVLDLLNALHREKRLHGKTKNTMAQAWDYILEWHGSDALWPDGLSSTGFKNQTPGGLASKVKGDGSVPAHPALTAIEEVVEFSRNPPNAQSQLLRHACHWLAERLETVKQQRSEMGFQDLLTRLDRALAGPRGETLAANLRAQFPAALIDEFQDTDPVQYRIFKRVYRVEENSPEHCLLMIGDPKQAIYGFRGADIHTYLSARRAVAERTYTLGRNFRSAGDMVAAVNRLFERAEQHCPAGAFLFGRDADSALPFRAVEANGTPRHFWREDQQSAALTFWVQEAEQDDKGKTRYVTREAYKQHMAEACAGEIVHCLNRAQEGRAGFARDPDGGDLVPLAAGDIAVLVNDRTEADVVRRALRRRGVKSVYLSDRESVLEAPEAREVLCWLKAFAEPTRLSRVRAALATSSLGRTYPELAQLLSDEAVLEREIQRFMDYQRIWQSQGVLPMLHRFLMDFAVPGRLLAKDRGERSLTDILHIAELLQEAGQQLDGEHALVHHYAQLLSGAEEEDDHRILRLESDASLVQVITVHKSKGLEYPLVFLPFATAFKSVPSRKNLHFVEYRDGDNGKRVALRPDKDQQERADRDRLGEDIRKLYVALTRARYAAWVGAAAVNQWDSSALGYLLNGAVDRPLAPRLEALEATGICRVQELPEPAGDMTYRAPPPAALGPVLEPGRNAADDWWIASYSAIHYGSIGYGATDAGARRGGGAYREDVEDTHQQNLLEAEAEEGGTRPAAPQMNQHSFPKGAVPGTFLHDLLEWCARQGFARVLADPAGLREQLAKRCATRGWQEWQPVLEKWLLQLLNLPLALPDGDAVSLGQLDNPRPEMEFWLESRAVDTTALDRLVSQYTLAGADRPAALPDRFNGMLKGFIDLVFQHGGRYYVLDYKSNLLGPDDRAYEAPRMGQKILEKRYDLQYCLYLLALHRLLRARLPDYDYDRHVGGALYYFLRGCNAPGGGIFVDRPPAALIQALDALFDGREVAA